MESKSMRGCSCMCTSELNVAKSLVPQLIRTWYSPGVGKLTMKLGESGVKVPFARQTEADSV